VESKKKKNLSKEIIHTIVGQNLEFATTL
jgi:hypothetical protein